MKRTTNYNFLLLLLLYGTHIFCAIQEEALAALFKQHCTLLKNTDIQQAPFVITFSGTPGMGKSFIAKLIEERCCAVRVSTDEIRSLLASLDIKPADYDQALFSYFTYFMQHYTLPNKRIIVDASIDRKYKQVFAYLKKNKVNYLVVRLEVPRELIIERIKQREGIKAEFYYKNLDGWLKDYEEFGKKNVADITFDNSTCGAYDNLIDQISMHLSKS